MFGFCQARLPFFGDRKAARSHCIPTGVNRDMNGFDENREGTRVPEFTSTARQSLNSLLIKSLCRRGRVIVAEDKAHDRVESGDSGRECNAVIRPEGPDAARMDFFNGLLMCPIATENRRHRFVF